MIKNSFNRNLLLVFLMFNILICFSQKRKIKFINSPLMQAPYLQKDDTVMILATAGIISDSTIVENGIKLLKSWGLKVKLGKNLYKQNGHFAGTDEDRVEDFQEALDDKSIKAIWCARGGYGTVRIIDQLDFSNFEKNPKWIIGFSDVTVLHNVIHNLGRESLHALMPSTLKLGNEEQQASQESFRKALFGEELAYEIESSQFNKKGRAKGQLTGGNLSILYSVLGSKTSLKTDGKILFIEDLGEYAYHVDRMMQNLKRNGYFENCYGLIIGGITKVRENDVAFGIPVEQIILDIVADYNFPVVFDFPAGHIRDNRALILGREILLKVRENKTVIKFKD